MLKIDCNYPGGNIKVISINKNVVKVEQDLRDTKQWWFYWNFSMESIPDEEITVEFINGEVVGPWGPAVSYDGITWDWLGPDSLTDRKSFRYKPQGINKKVYFSFSLPYLLQNFEMFYSRYKGHQLLQREVLGISEQGRPMPVLKFGNPLASQDIVFICRHHACESIAAYILEGVMTYLLDKESPMLSHLIRNYMIHVIPFVDIDGVENGDQGKGRWPHDHGQDYIEKPIYKETAAVMEYVKKLNLIMGIDFHSLAKWGAIHDHPLFVRQMPPRDEEVKKFGNLFRQICWSNPDPDKVVYEQLYDKYPWESWEPETEPIMNMQEFLDNIRKEPQYTAPAFFGRRNARLAFTFESPYFGTSGNIITRKSATGLGKDFAKALELYVLN